MKASNIYQTLKTKGHATDGTKPMLPGVGSPLKKSPYKFNAGLKKAAADGSLDSNPKFKEAVQAAPTKLKNDPVKKPTIKETKYSKYGYKKDVVKPISTSYNSKTGELTKVFSDKDVKDKKIKKVQVTKASEKSPATPAKKKSCGSPVKLDIENVAGRPNPKKAMRKAKRRANRGTKAAVKKFKACKRSIGGGKGSKI